MKRLAYVAISLMSALPLLNCGGSKPVPSITQPPTTTTSSIVVTVTPSSTNVNQGDTFKFTASVSGTSDQRVTWSTTGGSITDSGVYTAPASSGSFIVVARSQADTSSSGTGTAVVPSISIAIEPFSVGVTVGGTQKFTPHVYGTVLNQNVTWQTSGGGSISPDGLYTAALTPGGPFPVTATSVADPLRSASASVWVDDKSFQSTGDMVSVRECHTATRLQNGDVLIAGGVGQAGAADPGAEIFVSSSQTFQASAPMTEVRYGHTATLLQDGKVLIAGGRNSLGDCTKCSSKTAEIFDPSTQTFSPTGSMSIERSFHAAALMNDGRVLISGGATNVDPRSATMEIYDPATGQFSAAATMSTSRSRHTMTVLPNGKVFIAGGEGTATLPFTGETFDASNGTFTKLQIFPKSRNAHTATLMSDGSVLLGGGGAGFGGADYPYYQSRVYNSSAGTVSNDIQLAIPRMYHTATLIKAGTTEEVLLTGGLTLLQLRDVSSEVFIDGHFRPSVQMKRARVNHAATLLNDGSVLITGGSNDKTAEIYK